MKREDIDVMEAKARAALESLPTPEAVLFVRAHGSVSTREARWEVEDDPEKLGLAIVSGLHTVLHDMSSNLSQEVAEHIAASDPHAVLALIAELRRVEQERDEYWAQGEQLAVALAPVRGILRDLQRPYWDETEVARWGLAVSLTLPQARELAAACDAVDPEPPLRNAD